MVYLYSTIRETRYTDRHYVKVANEFFETEWRLKYVEKTVINQYKLTFINKLCLLSHSVGSFVFLSVVQIRKKLKLLKALLFLDMLYGYKTLSFTLIEECTCILQVSKWLNFRFCKCKEFYTILLWYKISLKRLSGF